MPSEEPQLVRALGLWECSAIVIGIMIGTAIFLVPAQTTREVASRDVALAVWAFAGLLSLFGALAFAELAAMLPQAGGQYVYLREAYGPLVSFLCGWAFFLASQTGGISALAVGFARYLDEFVPLSPWAQKSLAAASIALFTVINARGVREGGRVQSLLTGLKIGAVAGLIVLGYWMFSGSPAPLPLPHGPARTNLVSSFGVAMIGALWAYEGWNTCTFVAEEVKRPERNLPLALVIGTMAVIVIYLGLNALYYHVLSLPEIARSPRVAADAAVRIWGRVGSQIVALIIIVSTLGSLNGSILAAPRVYYRMAQDGLFFRWCAAIHPRFRTPHLALAVQGVWAILLVAMGTYEQLFTFTVIAAWLFYALAALAVIILRRTLPHLARPYRVFGYPYVPVTFALAAVWLIVNTLIEQPLEAGIGFGLVAIGVPVYLIWNRHGR